MHTPDPPSLEQAQAFLNKRRFTDALRESEAVLQLNPQNAEAHNVRGLALDELGYTANALLAYQAAVRLNPRLKEAQDNLRETEVELSVAESGHAHFQQPHLQGNLLNALKLHPLLYSALVKRLLAQWLGATMVSLFLAGFMLRDVGDFPWWPMLGAGSVWGGGVWLGLVIGGQAMRRAWKLEALPLLLVLPFWPLWLLGGINLAQQNLSVPAALIGFVSVSVVGLAFFVAYQNARQFYRRTRLLNERSGLLNCAEGLWNPTIPIKDTPERETRNQRWLPWAKLFVLIAPALGQVLARDQANGMAFLSLVFIMVASAVASGSGYIMGTIHELFELEKETGKKFFWPV